MQPTKIDKAIYLLANIWAELPRCQYGAEWATSDRGEGRVYHFYFNGYTSASDLTTTSSSKPLFSLFSLIGQDNKDEYRQVAQELISTWRHYWSI